MEKIGRYSILKKISSGGMGEVYSAKFDGAQGFQKKVVIKCLPFKESKFEKYLHHEALVLSELNHPNIVHVYDYGQEGDFCYLVMEEVEGWDLEELLFERSKIFPHAAVFILNEILEGLNYAHTKGVIHRDLSPSNILISRDGVVKIADFGVAEFVHSERPKTLHGKFSYLTPEVARGGQASISSDLFSLGLIFYEMISGEKYTDGETDFEILENARNFKKYRTKLRDQKINLFLEKVLQKNPLKRMAQASRWHKELVENFDIPERAEFLEYLRELREKTAVIESVLRDETVSFGDSLKRRLSTKETVSFVKKRKLVLLGLCASFIMAALVFSKFQGRDDHYGFLSLRTKPWSYVEVQGQRYQTPLYRLKVKAGSYKIKLSQPHGSSKTRLLDILIKEGENTTIQQDL